MLPRSAEPASRAHTDAPCWLKRHRFCHLQGLKIRALHEGFHADAAPFSLPDERLHVSTATDLTDRPDRPDLTDPLNLFVSASSTVSADAHIFDPGCISRLSDDGTYVAKNLFSCVRAEQHGIRRDRKVAIRAMLCPLSRFDFQDQVRSLRAWTCLVRPPHFAAGESIVDRVHGRTLMAALAKLLKVGLDIYLRREPQVLIIIIAQLLMSDRDQIRRLSQTALVSACRHQGCVPNIDTSAKINA